MKYKVRLLPERRVTKLKKLLTEKGISQIQLARKTGMPKCQISKLCTGEQVDILLSTALRICNALNCHFDEAFGDY